MATGSSPARPTAFRQKTPFTWLQVLPAAGWGAGLLIHGLAVWLVPPGGSLWQRLLERERAALQRRQGTH